MFNRTLGVAGFAAVAAALAFATADVSPKLRAFADKLSSADALQATYTVQQVGGASRSVTLALARPNKARIETGSTLTVADGTTITVLDKAANSYYKKPQTEGDFNALFDGFDMTLWRGFFAKDAWDKVSSSKDGGSKTVGGKPYDVVTVTADPKGEMTMTLYLDKADSLPRIAEMVTKGMSTTTNLVRAQNVSLSADAGLFAFAAPNGAKEMDYAAMQVGKWYHDFDEARKVAQATGKVMLVDFYAVWCGPCKMMDAEAFQSAAFKDKAKDFVLVKIDAEKDVALAQKYGVSAYPTVKFIDGDGKVVHQFVGYGGVGQVLGDMDKARASR